MTNKNSQLSGFYRKTVAERREILRNAGFVAEDDLQELISPSFGIDEADHMVENVISLYGFPYGIAMNFRINDTDYLIPMVTEEPSVIAATSYAAKLFRETGGITAHSDDPIMIGQLQVLDVDDLNQASQALLDHRERLLAEVNENGGSIVKRGGGARDIEVRLYRDTPVGDMLVMHLLMDVRDAMGANAINTAVETLAPSVEAITGGRVNLRILSNLTDRRKAYAEARVLPDSLATETIPGVEAVQQIIEAGVFAEVDPYRAATHNKGIMNGIDAVALATGNDWRALEAGAHAFAAQEGRYGSLTRWWRDDDGSLCGSIELPLAVGTVGGATRVHPMARLSLRLLGNPGAQQLAEIMAAVGLAQNFAAIRALAMEGIQQGHMRMHARQLAVAAGATAEQVRDIAAQLVREKNIRLQRATELVEALQNTSADL